MGQHRLEPGRIREAITAIPDVASCDVEMDGSGGISAVHVVTRSQRPPKQIVRDVESVLAAEFGLKIDHRKVSVARVEVEGRKISELGGRARLVSIKLSTEGAKGYCEVVLERNDSRFKGEASGVPLGTGRLRLIARATSQAICKMAKGYAELDLIDLLKIRCGETNAVVVILLCVAEGEPKELAGCVPYSDDDQSAVALAVLDACNRIVERLPRVERTEYEIFPHEEA
ncbi:MAG: hypothetical protein ACUVUU_05840 [bacterium]